jgi:hypothetical protein
MDLPITVTVSHSRGHLRERQWRFDRDHKGERMKPTDRLPFTQWADVNRTDRFICVRPKSGYSMIQPEDDGYVIYLPPDATDQSLGQAHWRHWIEAGSFGPPMSANSSNGRDMSNAIRIGSRISCSATATRPNAMLTRTWTGAGPKGRRGRYPSSRISATSRNILETFRRIEQSSFRRRGTRPQPVLR